MKKNYFRIIGFVLMACFSLNVSAGWEMIREQKASYGFHITPNGTFLISDYLYDGTGGIYYSLDKGATWTHADAPDYCYEDFVDAGDWVFALGGNGRLARSNDQGLTWEILNYGNAVSDRIDPEETVCYSATYHKGKLWIGDFTGGGIIYSEDFGETWVLTDVVSLQYEVQGKDGKLSVGTESIYNLVSYKDELYAFGVYFVYRYDDATNAWEMLRNDSNFLVVSAFHDGKLCCGRSVMNQDENDPFIECFDGETWTLMNRPADFNDNNIRAMHSDGKNLYVGHAQKGFLFTPDSGENWYHFSDGIPLMYQDNPELYLTLLSIDSDEDYVYLLVYDTPFSKRGGSGLYRVAKSELAEVASVADILENNNEVYVDGSVIYTGECVALYVSDLSGKNIPVEVVDGKADISNLEKGVYVYRVVSDGASVAGKFVKK